MFMAAAASIYSTSPPSVSSAPNSSHCVSSSLPELEFLPRPVAIHHLVSRPVLGGLSALFAGSAVRYSPSPDNSDGFSLSRRSSQNDLCALWDGNESWSDAISFSSSGSLKTRERSPVSVLQGSSSFCSGQGSARPNGAIPEKSLRRASLSADVQLSVSDRNESSSAHGNLEFCPRDGSVIATLGNLDVYTQELETRPGNSRLTKFACSSLSELFCKPLFPETLRTSQDILHHAQRRHEILKDPVVIRAFEEAEQAHHGQFRVDGDPYLVHCVETAKILAAIGANKVVVAAGLLHDTVDDSSVTLAHLQKSFGTEVANLVEGVTKLSEFSKLARDNGTAYKTVEADRLHTMILAMADVRVVLVKLADRLHNMRTLGVLQKEKQFRIAKETLEVFVPLAGRLGIWSWKAEMEDLCFKHLKPQEYQELSIKLAQGFREATIVSAILKLDEALLEMGVQCYDLCGRPKNLYSLYKKMIRKGRNVNEIYDVQGLRVIVSNEKDCYSALEIVHQLWSCVPGKLKDYISHPKVNGYQSLHTVVWGDDGLPLEIQIRTKEMHHQAEFGVAAHWRYKEGNIPQSSFVLQTVEWARWILSWQNEIIDSKLQMSRVGGHMTPACPFPLHKESCIYSDVSRGPPCHEEDPLFVIILEGEKMHVQELPGGSTVADLLHRTATEDVPASASGIVFLEELRPKVNHEAVKDSQQVLKMGDLVELVPSIPGTSISEYREKLKRIFSDCATQSEKRKQDRSWERMSEITVF